MNLLLAAQQLPEPAESLAYTGVVATYAVAAAGGIASTSRTSARKLTRSLYFAARLRLYLANLLVIGSFSAIPLGISAVVAGDAPLGSAVISAAPAVWFSYWRASRATQVTRDIAYENSKQELEFRRLELENERLELELGHKRRTNEINEGEGKTRPN
jgi:hypothetical protein